ncbi:type II toxin-antitoxin system HicB family antitoxin [Candidatus Bipolaricaulota bacterium]|nr:type II toxin-antitoxin system HicB family antitoxin [Candidatus Bipolaricaulota bacterium]
MVAQQVPKTGKVWIYVCFERDSGGYLGKAPGLPGCVTWASSLGEAKDNMKEATAAYIESAFANNITIKTNQYVRTARPKTERKLCRPSLMDRLLKHAKEQIEEWQDQQMPIAV